jgi:hypothetical protein
MPADDCESCINCDSALTVTVSANPPTSIVTESTTGRPPFVIVTVLRWVMKPASSNVTT